jgi:dihydropteroate synthase
MDIMLTLDYLSKIYDSYQDSVNVSVEEFTLEDKPFNFNKTPAIMGVVNLSSDSRCRESVCVNFDLALRCGKVLTAQGADIIDIGAESSRPTSKKLDPNQQTDMLIPVLRAFKQEKIITSIDTYYPEVAKTCLAAGANLINLTGVNESKAVYDLVSEFDAAVIICYVQGKHARDTKNFSFGDDPITAMYDYFAYQIDLATSVGVKKIIVDAGMGFSYQNLAVNSSSQINFRMKTLLTSFRLRKLGFPIANLLPSSVFLGFGQEVRTAEVFFAVLAALGKTDLFRTHEVPKIKAVLEAMCLFQDNNNALKDVT